MDSEEFVAGEGELGEYEPITTQGGDFASSMGPAHTNVEDLIVPNRYLCILRLRKLD